MGDFRVLYVVIRKLIRLQVTYCSLDTCSLFRRLSSTITKDISFTGDFQYSYKDFFLFTGDFQVL